MPNLVGKKEKGLLWEEQMTFFRKDKWVFRRTNGERKFVIKFACVVQMSFPSSSWP